MLRIAVLQFGGGNFLRAFTDLFLHQANTNQEVGRAVVVTSTESDRTRLINAQAGTYHVVVRGLSGGQQINETIRVDGAIDRALSATSQWPEIRQTARSTDLRWIVSNTTEAGLQLAPEEITAWQLEGATETPVSFPAKLLALLAHRHKAGLPGLTVLPCELVDSNADVLRCLVLEQAQRWRLSDSLLSWLDSQCTWVNTLVDRIVSGRPPQHPLLARDGLLTMTEPFALWAVEDQGDLDLFPHPAIERVPDVTPYSLRKVRLLNGAHTALVARALPLGLETVGEAVAHPEIGPWLRQLLEQEVLPALGDRIHAGAKFSDTTLERFANPWLHHRLSDIAMHHETKMKTRLQPSFDDYVERFGDQPKLLTQILTETTAT